MRIKSLHSAVSISGHSSLSPACGRRQGTTANPSSQTLSARPAPSFSCSTVTGMRSVRLHFKSIKSRTGQTAGRCQKTAIRFALRTLTTSMCSSPAITLHVLTRLQPRCGKVFPLSRC